MIGVCELGATEDTATSEYKIDTEGVIRQALVGMLMIPGVITCSAFSDGITIERADSTADPDRNTLAIIHSQDMLSLGTRILRELSESIPEYVTIESDSLKMVISPIDDSAGLVTVCGADTALGMVRLQMKHIIEEIAPYFVVGDCG
ncbi:MAG: hypothetical protein J7J06_00805 [Methanosarcinales archaeon]|nr:hypothetical protein [Methanosarcinales archaeon]